MNTQHISKKEIFFKKIPRGAPYVSSQGIFNSLFLYNQKKYAKKDFIQSFEDEFSKQFNAKSAVAFPYARIALYFILKSYNFAQGSEIITTPITISDIINVILMHGLKPVFVDMGKNTANVNANSIEKMITLKTKAILVTHLNGSASDMNIILKVAKKHNLVVIEDASQGIGAKYDNIYLGLLGDVGVFSISSHKPLCTFTGGVALTNNINLANELKKFAKSLPRGGVFLNFYRTISELILYILSQRIVFSLFTYYIIKFMNMFSFNFCDSLQHFDPIKTQKKGKVPTKCFTAFSTYQAKIGIERLRIFNELTAKRCSLGEQFYSNLQRYSIPGLVNFPKNSTNIFWRFPLWVDDRPRFRKYLFERYIDTTIAGLDCCNRKKEFEEFCSTSTPEAFKFMDNMVFLPIHPSMETKQINYITKVIQEYYESI